MGAKNIYERFVWLDDQVRVRKYPNATTLAQQFEISAKTAQRDIDFMRDRLLCPLDYDSSKKGYYYANETFSLPMVYLSSEELSALLIARKMLQDISGGKIGQEISSIMSKITNLVSRHAGFGNEIDDDVSFQLIGYSPLPEKIFKVVLEGCLKQAGGPASRLWPFETVLISMLLGHEMALVELRLKLKAHGEGEGGYLNLFSGIHWA
jgi:hypothetical protein